MSLEFTMVRISVKFCVNGDERGYQYFNDPRKRREGKLTVGQLSRLEGGASVEVWLRGRGGLHDGRWGGPG